MPIKSYLPALKKLEQKIISALTAAGINIESTSVIGKPPDDGKARIANASKQASYNHSESSVTTLRS